MSFKSNVWILALSGLMLAGCAVVADEVMQPSLVARLDSEKSVADFAACAAQALGTRVQTDDGLTYIYLKNGMGVLVTRWDFVHTTSGSQAELRSDDPEKAGIDAVRNCA